VRRGEATVAVLGLGLWMPGYPSVAAWAGAMPEADADKPQGRGLDPANRRRAGVLGRAIADASAQAMQEADVDPSTVATIVGSSIGEAATMIGLLDQMWRTKTPMSPAAFTVSVHNASSGLLSISSKNQGYATSLAADEDTPGMALLEAVGLALRGDPVLVACGDEAAPRSLVKNAPHWEILAGAVVLAPLDYERPRHARLSVLAGEQATLRPAALDQDLARNPQAGLIDLVDAILRREPGRVRLDRGKGRGWLAELDFDADR